MIDTEYLEILRDMTIERLGLDKNTVSSLYEENIYTIGDLLKKSNDELLIIAARRHFSIRTIVERLQGTISELAVKGFSITYQASANEGEDIAASENDSEPESVEVVLEDSQEQVPVNNESVPFISDFGSDPVRNHEEEKKEKDIFQTRVVDLEISTKTYFALRFSNIETVKDLVSTKQDELKKNNKRINENRLKEIAEAVELLFTQAGREDEIQGLPFFSTKESDNALIRQDYQDNLGDDTLYARYGELYLCTKRALKEEYTNGRMWIKLEDICEKIKEKNHSLLKDYIDNRKVELILEKASWSTSRSIYYCWNSNALNSEDDGAVTISNGSDEEKKLFDDSDVKTIHDPMNDMIDTSDNKEPLEENVYGESLIEQNQEESVSTTEFSLEDCIRIILTNRKRIGKEWITAMSVYDEIRCNYPLIAEKSQLVDIRDVLTKSNWIQKDDFYFRLAPDAREATDNEMQTKEAESNCGLTPAETSGQTEVPETHPVTNLGEDNSDLFTTTLIGNVSNERIAEIGNVEIEALGLSVRSYNCLSRAQIFTIRDLLLLKEEELLTVRNLGNRSAREILEKAKIFVSKFDFAAYIEDRPNIPNTSADAFIGEEIVRPKRIIDGHVVFDIPIEQMGLSKRAYNCLKRSEINSISQLAELTIDDLMAIQNMGRKSAQEIVDTVEHLIQSGQIGVSDTEADYDKVINDHYNSEAFKSKLAEQLVDTIRLSGFTGRTKEDLYNIVGSKLHTDQAEQLIEEALVDLQKNEKIYLKHDKYYTHYVSVVDAVEELPNPGCDMILKRLEGMTLEEVSREFNVTRERVRQIVSKQIKALKKKHICFSEDAYAYLYENYIINRNDWNEILGLPEYIFNYFQIIYKKGFNSSGYKTLLQAVDDTNVDIEIRRAIKEKDDENYIVVGNRRIPKERKYIEDYVISQYFRDEGSLETFYETYNRFLEANSVEDLNLYATNDVKRTRENRLADSRKLLWKQNRRLRYYDIDGTDFEELLGTLELEQYENIEISTLKFFRDYPELMKEYDIRDEYELHNLLKKICDPNDYHEMVFGRMPGIVFGKFDRDEAVKEMMFNLAPISQDDLADAIYEKYGVKPLTVKANWLGCISVYYINGEYHTEEEDDHPLSDAEFDQFSKLLSGNFYFTEEVDKAYSKLIGNSSYKESPKPYILKKMGFSVYSGYICRGLNATDFFVNLLTSQEIVDLSEYGSKIRAITMYNQIEYSLREEYEILEFEPYKFVNISRLKSFGIEKSDLRSYCNEVKKYVGEDRYFTLPYLRKEGFSSKLDELGFDDFFYEALLSLDPGIFSIVLRSRRNGSALLRVGTEMGSKSDFLISIIEKEGSIDKDDLINYCKDNYNIVVNDNALYKGLEDSDVYYDSVMGKYYANYSLYFDEI